MTSKALSKLNELLSPIVNYSFMRGDASRYPFWEGDYNESGSQNEDNSRSTILTLSGTSNSSWESLEIDKEKIIDALDRNQYVVDGGTVAFFYESSIVVPVEDASYKRMEMRFTVREWRQK